jgi:hypothetical protein
MEGCEEICWMDVLCRRSAQVHVKGLFGPIVRKVVESLSKTMGVY